MDEFHNDKVRFKVHRKPQCIVEFEVEASAPLVLDALKKAMTRVAKEVVVPGFRKGKAPEEIVSKRYPQELDKQWQQVIADLAYRECAPLAQIPLLRSDSSITFKMESHNKERAKLTLSFETVPHVPEIDPSKLELKLPEDYAITPDKVEEATRQIRFFFAKWIPVTDRPVQEGDFVLIDLDSLETDPATRVFTKTRFEVKDEQMAQWMKALVIGKSVGETVEGISFPDAHLPEEKKAEFEPRKVRVTIVEIEAVELPPIDEEFAKQLGLSSAEEIAPRIEAVLKRTAQQNIREQQREQVTEFLATIPFELPRSLVEREAQFRLEQMMRDEKSKREWDALSSDKRREIISGLLKESERAVRVFYLCRALSAKENITINTEDLQQMPTDLLEVMLNPNAHMHDPRSPEIKQAEAYSKVMLEKTADWILSRRAVAQ